MRETPTEKAEDLIHWEKMDGKTDQQIISELRLQLQDPQTSEYSKKTIREAVRLLLGYTQ